jgi:hypothetical protein
MADDPGGVRAPRPRARGQGRCIRHNRLIVRRLLRLGALTLAAAVIATIAASSVAAALFFLFKPAAAKPGDLVTVRLGGTPATFTLAARKEPLRRPMRIYLVPNGVASDVESRFDGRLHFVGLLVPDANGRGVLTFRAPPLDTAAYAVAAWCPECARNSFGKTFFVLGVSRFTLSRFPGMLLRLRMPDASVSCPATRPEGSRAWGSHGNGLLAATLPGSGVMTRPREPDGTLFQKLGWTPSRGLRGDLVVRGERLDAPGRLLVLSVNWGSSSDGRVGWASAVKFPSEGCWRLTGRVGDIALSYVVKVVAGP